MIVRFCGEGLLLRGVLVNPHFSQGELIKGVIVGSIAGFSTKCAIREDDSIPDTLFFPMAETGRDGDRPLRQKNLVGACRGGG